MAREDHAKRGVAFAYFDVTKNQESMKRMLEYTNGQKSVPVIVEGGLIRIGFEGGA
jgi:glutaredoxin 3